MKITVLLAALLSASVAFAGPPAPKKTGIEGEGYVWNAQEGEKIEALQKKGDITRGEEAYEVCGACHLPSGAGRPDGTFPQLAGQNAAYAEQQMKDIKSGARNNGQTAAMKGVMHLVNDEEIKAIATWLESLK